MDKHSPVDLIIFDCDGVLVDSELIVNRILQQGLSDLGWELTLQQTMDHFMGKSLKHCIDDIENHLGKRTDPEFWRGMQQKTFAAFETDLKPVPGICEVLNILPYRKCVASSGSQQKMRKTLGLTGLLSYFDDCLFSGTEVARGKPFPDLFLYAAEQMTCRPAHCVVVEDSPFGIEAAIRADMRVPGYCQGTNADNFSAKGAVTFKDMSDLPGLIGELDED